MKPDPRLTRHVDRIYPDLQDLFAAGEAVEDLLAHPGWLHITRLIEYETATVDFDLDGRAEPLSQAEYAMAHGRRGGLRAIEGASGAILSKYRSALEAQRRRHERGAESPQEA